MKNTRRIFKSRAVPFLVGYNESNKYGRLWGQGQVVLLSRNSKLTKHLTRCPIPLRLTSSSNFIDDPVLFPYQFFLGDDTCEIAEGSEAGTIKLLKIHPTNNFRPSCHRIQPYFEATSLPSMSSRPFT